MLEGGDKVLGGGGVVIVGGAVASATALLPRRVAALTRSLRFPSVK